MKKMIKKLSVVLLGVFGLAVLVTGSARADVVEYKNIIDQDRFINALNDPQEKEYRNIINLESFVASLEDQRDNKFCSAEKTGVVNSAAAEVLPDTEYRNLTDLERFIAALKDPTSREYRNLMTLERFVAGLGEDSKAPEYRNIVNMASFVSALKDSREVEYRNIFDLETFVAALKDNKTEGTSVAESICQATTDPASYTVAMYEVGTCM